MQRGRQRRRTRDAEPQPARAPPPARGSPSACVHRGHTEEERRVVVVGGVEHQVGVEPREQHGRGAGTATCRGGPTPRPCTWKSGSASTSRSVAVQRHARRSASALASALPWVSIAPFGAPVGARRVAEQRDVVGSSGVERRRGPRRAASTAGVVTTHPSGATLAEQCRAVGIDDACGRRCSRRRCGRSLARCTRRSPARPRARAAARRRARPRAPTDVTALITIRSPATQPGRREAARDASRTSVELGVGEPAVLVVDRGRVGRRRPVRRPRRRQAAPGQQVDRRGIDARRQVARPLRSRGPSHAAEATGGARPGPARPLAWSDGRRARPPVCRSCPVLDPPAGGAPARWTAAGRGRTHR